MSDLLLALRHDALPLLSSKLLALKNLTLLQSGYVYRFYLTFSALFFSYTTKGGYLLKELSTSFYFPVALAVIIFSLLGRGATTSDNEAVVATKRSPRHALMHFLIPTCSVWPASYATLCAKLEQNSRLINLDMSTLIKYLVDGTAELRCPHVDLPLLLSDRLVADGWSIALFLSVGDWARLLLWLMKMDLLHSVKEVSGVGFNLS